MAVLNRKWFAEYALVLLWFGMQTALFFIYGIHTNLEAEKYTGAAAYLSQHGTLPATKYIFYSVLILIIYFFQNVGAGFGGVVLFQMLLNGVATFYLYRMAYRTTNSIPIARLTAFLFIIFFPSQTWNVYLFTESLFISFTIFFTYLLVCYPPDTLKNFSIHVLGLTILCLTRPFGFLFIIPFMLYAILVSKGRFRLLLLSASVIATFVFFMLINAAFKGGEDMDAMKPFREGHIICFIPDPNPAKLQLIESGNPVYDIGYYIVHNPTHFLTLLYKRIFSFYNITRPYYSKAHNLALLMFIVPVYSFGLLALIKFKLLLRSSIFRFIIILILFYTLAIAFQCDDFHSRFTMPLFGFFFLFAACGFYYSTQRKNLPA